MRKLIYLFIVPFFPSKSSHGGSYIYDQVMSIKATNKYDVVVIMHTPDINKSGDYEFGGIKVHRFKERHLPSAIWDGFFDSSNFNNFENCLKRLNIRVENIAVVHAHVFRQGIYANKLKQQNPNILTILQHHGYDVLGLNDGIFSNHKWHRHHVVKYGVNICNNIDLHVGVSQATLECLTHYKRLVIKDQYVLYNGVDTVKFHPLSKTRKDRFTIGCIANFWKVKDHISLIKAVEILVKEYSYNIEAILVGTGAELDKCKKYVDINNLINNITFKKPIPHDQLINFYNSLDLFVLPSYWDTFGCVYLEAYACGIPFITAEGTGVKELIPESERSMWVAPKSDPVQLAKMIKNYIDNRYKQTLTTPIDINYFIGKFLETVERKRVNLS